jgi:lysophospholipid hydrolase
MRSLAANVGKGIDWIYRNIRSTLDHCYSKLLLHAHSQFWSPDLKPASNSDHVQLNFYALAFLFCIGCVCLSFLIRFRYLSTYKTLREPPLERPSAIELHPDVNKAEEQTSFHNYLDEFLQAVRVFGFLEKPVFHELARHLQTRRLIAGDTLSLDADKSFYCVVDGNVQVFAPPSNASRDEDDSAWGGPMNGYQLLNDVGSGGTLSSLFTILSLFTENIQLRWSDEDGPTNAVVTPSSSASSQPDHSTSRKKRGRFDSDVSHLDLGTADEGVASPRPAVRRTGSIVSSHSSTSTIQGVLDQPNQANPTQTPTVSDDAEPDWTSATWSPPSESRSSPGTPQYRPSEATSDYFSSGAARPAKAHNTNAPQQGIIARATTDATLAVIPAEAFRRLTQKFPKASAHIVQGRLLPTCLSRVANVLHRSHLNSILSCHISVCSQIPRADL